MLINRARIRLVAPKIRSGRATESSRTGVSADGLEGGNGHCNNSGSTQAMPTLFDNSFSNGPAFVQLQSQEILRLTLLHREVHLAQKLPEKRQPTSLGIHALRSDRGCIVQQHLKRYATTNYLRSSRKKYKLQ
jgi:hypothetical protein